MAKFYTGVGSRKTPPAVQRMMTSIAKKLHEDGYRLRSGGAVGADLAFEAGTPDAMIFTPGMFDVLMPGTFEKCWAYVERLHPNPRALKSEYVCRLMARNVFQVLGLSLDMPSDFLICWTPDGCTSHAERSFATGGTGMAISVADEAGIEVFNLKRPEHFERLRRYIS